MAFYTKKGPRNSWISQFVITFWYQKSRNAGTSCSSTPGKVALTNIILSDQCAISGASGSWIAPAGARRMPFKGRSRLQWFFQNSCRLELSVKASDHFSLFPCIPKQTPNVQCAICFCKYIVTFHFWQWTPVNPSDCNLSEKNTHLSSNGIIYQWSKGRHHLVIFDVTKLIVEIDFETPFRIKSIQIVYSSNLSGISQYVHRFVNASILRQSKP